MNETNNFILLKSEPEAVTMYKETALKINNKLINHDKPLNKTIFYNNKNKNKMNTFKIRIDKKLRKSGSLINVIASKTQQTLESNKLNDIKGKMGSILPNKENDISKMNSSKQVSFNLTNNVNIIKKNFYLTSPLNSMYKKIKVKNESNSTRATNYMIDLIHKKETELCLDLIKKLPENGLNIEKNIDDKKEANLEETNNLIELIRNFNFDNVNNLKRIEYQIINDNNNSFSNSYILKPDINPTNDLSISMTTNFKTNNLLYNTGLNQNINNLPIDKNLNNSSIELKNNNSSIIQNSSNIINEKSKLVKSFSTNNISKIKDPRNDLNFQSNRMEYFKNEINFHTGFVRNQKNLYNQVFKSFRKRNNLRPKRYKKPKKESEKLSLPEIEEYKSIIKEIQNRKRKKLRKSQEIIEVKKERGELDFKDKLLDELHDIYQDQKNTFLWDLHDNYGGEGNKVKVDPLKEEINANIRNINQVKRKQNYFVDGYSLFTGKINKRLNEFNYILGNNFYDKDKKKEKEEKFHRCIEEYENKLNRYRDEFFKEYKIYKKIFKQKIDFRKDKNQENLEDNNFNFDKKYIIYN